ncbi:hypothetical protein [Terracidiphilus sp.]|uniref:hypothetical protein n=1 Tax=Terracidiphilus sp. TaxID=1964191 RepID=UPI003C1B67F8
MNSRMAIQRPRWVFAAIVLMLLAGAVFVSPLATQTTKKPAAAPAKPAAKPAAAPAKPGAAPARPGATTAKPGGGTGPVANKSAGPGPTTKTPTTGSGKPGEAKTTGGPARPGGNSGIKSPAPRGSNEHVAHNGATVRTRSDGRVSDIHDAKRGMDIHHGLDGGRRVSVERHDGSRLVTERGRRGFVERFYNHYYYRGGYMNVYAPGFYFAPGFYGWAYNPWATPIAYGWGWGASPWFAFYGGYFSPWRMYAGSAFWLADYMLAANLQAAYAAQAALAGAAGGAIPVAPAEPWTDSAFQVVQGQTYTISATGMLQFNGNATALAPPNGRTGGPMVDPSCAPGAYHSGTPAPQLPCLSLIGKIGPDGTPFEVGRTTTFVAPASGELFLGVNDGYLSDNSGGWVASVVPQR